MTEAGGEGARDTEKYRRGIYCGPCEESIAYRRRTALVKLLLSMAAMW